MKNIIVFINKVDLEKEPDMHALVEMEVRELLSHYEYDGDNTVFVKGSALAALEGRDPEIGSNAIDELVAAMDKHFTPGQRAVDKPFLMMVDGSLNIPGRGTVATGTIEQGKVKIGDDVHLIGIKRKPTPTQVVGLEAFRKTLDSGEAGDSVGVLLKGLLREHVSRGMCLVEPGKFKVNRHFKA